MKKPYKTPQCKDISIESIEIIAASTLNISNTRATGTIRGNSNSRNSEWKQLWGE